MIKLDSVKIGYSCRGGLQL